MSISVCAASALAVEPVEPPEFDPTLSLTGSCGESKIDPVPDPGCPSKKPPKAFANPKAIGIDPFGNEYVASYGGEEGKQGRIDVFSPAGVYILESEIKDEFGPKSVAVDSEGNVYVFDKTPGIESTLALFEPSVYEPAEEKIKYESPRKVIAGNPGRANGGVAVNASNDHVFVDWGFSIDEYSSAAEGNKFIRTITNKELFFSNFTAIDASRGRLYASSCANETTLNCFVLVLDLNEPSKVLKEIKGPEGEESEEGFFSPQGWISIAVDEENGDFYVGDLGENTNARVYQFDVGYNPLSTLAVAKAVPGGFEGGEPMQIAFSNAPGPTKNHHYLFVPGGLKNRALAFSPPKEQPPVVEQAEVTGIGENEAELQALVKPKGGETAYRIEYLTEQAYEEAGNSFEGAQLAQAGTILPIQQEAEVKAAINGLEPGIAYRFRVVAENNVGEDEEEATFTTYSDAPIVKECPEAIRSTYSTLLPDCRAYELVSPADTNGRPPRGVGFVGDRFTTLEASPGGEAVSFYTEGGTIPSLGGSGAFNGSPYRSTRTPSGWSTVNAGPSGAESSIPGVGSTSPDQGYLFWVAVGEGSAVIEGKDTHYVRYPDGHSALVGRGSLGTDLEAEGRLITENGAHIVFQGSKQLEPDAPPTGTQAVYDRTSDEVTHVVSLLPGGETPGAGASAVYKSASADGESIAFAIGSTLYLRVGNATTYEIGTGVKFAGISEEGTRIFYLKGGDLFAFDTGSEEAIRFTEVGNAVPVNVASDGTRAYFASPTAIEGSGQNPNGAVAEEGKDAEGKTAQNLYLSNEGQIHFVGTVTERDVVGEKNKESNGQEDGLGLWTEAFETATPMLSKDPSRTTSDGAGLLFSSRADLDGYAHPNVPEIYRYDATADQLHCISCVPTRTQASGGASLESTARVQLAPEPFTSAAFVPNLRADGKRAVFQSNEALVSSDNDGVQDIYEWEEQGVGGCNRVGGCIYLISSGHSEKSNYLYAISTSGNDVFFTTGDVLAGGDDSTVSIYDARVNGGFAEPTEEPCEGEGCKPDLTPPPPLAPPVTGSVGPSGNIEAPKPKHCPKGKHKAKQGGKEVCVKNKKKHHKKKHQAKKKGRAGK